MFFPSVREVIAEIFEKKFFPSAMIDYSPPHTPHSHKKKFKIIPWPLMTFFFSPSAHQPT